MGKYKIFNHAERMILQYLYEQDYGLKEIGYRLNRTEMTLRNELKRGYLQTEFLANGKPVYSVEKAEQLCRRRSPEESKEIVLTNETKQILNEIIQMEQELPRSGVISEKLFLLYRSLNPGNRRIEEAVKNEHVNEKEEEQ